MTVVRKTRGSSQRQLLLLAVFAVILSVASASEGQQQRQEEERFASFPRRLKGSTDGDCERQCKEPPLKDLQYFDGDDLLSPQTMLDRLLTHKGSYVSQLQQNKYGTTAYRDMFEPLQEVKDPVTNETKEERVNVGRRNQILKDPNLLQVGKNDHPDPNQEGPAWDRVVRKYTIKLLQIQLGIVQERRNAKAICLQECTDTGDGDEDNSRFLTTTDKETKASAASGGLYTQFTWVNGGHSASAGHGNFFRESYTAELERAVKPIARQIGLDFVTRNYAMGGTESAEEVALCFNSIFGRDVDSISWDYGMTDGHDHWKITLYYYRAVQLASLKDSLSVSQPGNIPHRPSLLAIHQGSDYNAVLRQFQELGATVLGFGGVKGVRDGMPDMFGLSDDEIQKIPPYVRYLKCDGRIEDGDPGCKDNKFNNTMCTKRKARTSWHPGWKAHALTGNQLAMAVLAIMEDALVNMIAEYDNNAKDNESLDEAKARIEAQLQKLNQQEQDDYDNILKTPIPEKLQPHIERWWADKSADTHLKDLDMEAFFKEPTFCHTALLPAEIRFQGLLTENFTHTTTDIYDQTYEKAVKISAIQAIENPGRRNDNEPTGYVDPRPEKADQFILGALDGEYQDCSEHLNLDKKDFFYVSTRTGWRTLTLPNKAEQEHYTEYNSKNPNKGWILACLAKCDWGKCPSGDLQQYFGWMRPKPRKGETEKTEAEIKAMGTIELEINGEKVTEASNMHSCYALKNKNNGHVWKPNKDGKYEIKGRVVPGDDDYAYIRFSSFVFL